MKTLKALGLSTFALVVLALAPLGVADAQVKVTAATPSSTQQGTLSLDVVIAGSGFNNTAKVQFLVSGTTNPGGITVKKVAYHNSGEVVATIDVADTANIAKFDIVVMLSDGRKGKGTTLFAVQSKADACTGATATFVFSKGATNATKTLYLANETATCTRLLYSFADSYGHYASFRVVSSSSGQEGRVVTTDGGSLILVRFQIGNNMSIDPAKIVAETIFDPAQAGNVDVDSFELARMATSSSSPPSTRTAAVHVSRGFGTLRTSTSVFLHHRAGRHACTRSEPCSLRRREPITGFVRRAGIRMDRGSICLTPGIRRLVLTSAVLHLPRRCFPARIRRSS